ncbi:hypothetical protein C8233_00705 [Halomonas sp. SF2003]|nr:hypothetical protein C8233_00705 [Halomonas sp. SF2003]
MAYLFVFMGSQSIDLQATCVLSRARHWLARGLPCVGIGVLNRSRRQMQAAESPADGAKGASTLLLTWSLALTEQRGRFGFGVPDWQQASGKRLAKE